MTMPLWAPQSFHEWTHFHRRERIRFMLRSVVGLFLKFLMFVELSSARLCNFSQLDDNNHSLIHYEFACVTRSIWSDCVTEKKLLLSQLKVLLGLGNIHIYCQICQHSKLFDIICMYAYYVRDKSSDLNLEWAREDVEKINTRKRQ